MGSELDPRVRRFQEIKAREKRQKLNEKAAVDEIKAVNPNLTDKQARQIHAAAVALKSRERRVSVRNRNGKRHNVQVVTK